MLYVICGRPLRPLPHNCLFSAFRTKCEWIKANVLMCVVLLYAHIRGIFDAAQRLNRVPNYLEYDRMMNMQHITGRPRTYARHARSAYTHPFSVSYTQTPNPTKLVEIAPIAKDFTRPNLRIPGIHRHSTRGKPLV